jgi:hypothetical protein
MKSKNQYAVAVNNLLARAQQEPVTIHFAGINARQEPLYNVITARGVRICLQGTEQSVVESLVQIHDQRKT